MSTFSSRLIEFIEYEGLNVLSFEEKIKCGKDTIGKSLRNNTTIGQKTKEKIIGIYPDLNIDWLMTGTGKMLRSQEKNASENTELLKKIAEKDKKIQELESFIAKMVMKDQK